MQDYHKIIKEIEPELEKTIAFLDNELKKIHTSRVLPSLVENIIVECFGQKFPLKQLAAISVNERRQLIIHPWDKSYLESIEKAILRSITVALPVVEKDLIRLSFPPLSEDYRKELIKKIHTLAEASRQTIRRWRKEAWDKIQEKFKEGEIREDDKYRAKDKLQDLIDEYNEKIEKMAEQKKKEIME